jgi:hypothetical protein
MGNGQSTAGSATSDDLPSGLKSPEQLQQERKEADFQSGIDAGNGAYARVQQYLDQGKPENQPPPGRDSIDMRTQTHSLPGTRPGETLHQNVTHATFPDGSTVSKLDPRYVVDQEKRGGSVVERTLMERQQTDPFPAPPGTPSAVPVALVMGELLPGGGIAFRGAVQDPAPANPLNPGLKGEDRHFEKLTDTSPMQTVFHGSSASGGGGATSVTFNPAHF